METVGVRTSARSMDYLPIAEHGIIGDLHSAALVGTDGTIDWYCCPRFDSPSVFGAILDRKRGGYFRIGPATQDSTQRVVGFSMTCWKTVTFKPADSRTSFTRSA